MSIDENEVLAKVAVASLEKSTQVFVKSIDSARRNISVAFQAGFSTYKERSAERYGYVRTLLHRDRPIPLADLYVGARLESEGELYDDDDLIKDLLNSAHLLVQGTAGGGKSIFLRYLNLVISNSKGGVLPLFYELKQLNGHDPQPIADVLHKHIQRHLPDISSKNFRDLVSEGRIIVLLDGFDEIDHTIRERYAKEISDFCKDYPSASIVVSSRPDDLASSVEKFTVFHVQPFNKTQAIELLTKLPYEETVREKFIDAVDRELYDKHSDFLSNPLLITMMLMTYQQFAEIPSKIHIFYQQAFEALFSWHDSSKDVFKRKSYTGLPIDEFQRIFSYFCASSYGSEQFSFLESNARERLKAAVLAEAVNVEVTPFLKDLLESTCLLQRDGIEITFVHRSFQEYFTAVFISRLNGPSAKRAIDSVLKRASSDLVLPMAYEINPSLIDKAWALPTINSLIKKSSGVNPSEDPLRFLSIFFDDMYIDKDTVWLTYYPNEIWSNRLGGLHRIYGSGIPAIGKNKQDIGKRAFWERLLSDEEFRDSIRPASYVDLDRYVQRGDLGHIGLKFRHVPKTILEYFDITPWALSQADFLTTQRAKVEARIKNRTEAFQAAFG